MPNYATKALVQFQHTPPQKQQDQPYPHVKLTYGAKCNIHNRKTIPPPSIRLERNLFKRYVEYFFSLHVLLIVDYF
jgi:hypothetical protein